MRQVDGEKVSAQYPGRSACLLLATVVERRRDEHAEVSRGHSSRCAQRRRPEHGRTEGNQTSMDEGDVDRRAEMPEDSQKVAGGTRENMERERQTSKAVERTLNG